MPLLDCFLSEQYFDHPIANVYFGAGVGWCRVEGVCGARSVWSLINFDVVIFWCVFYLLKKKKSCLRFLFNLLHSLLIRRHLWIYGYLFLVILHGVHVFMWFSYSTFFCNYIIVYVAINLYGSTEVLEPTAIIVFFFG